MVKTLVEVGFMMVGLTGLEETRSGHGRSPESASEQGFVKPHLGQRH